MSGLKEGLLSDDDDVVLNSLQTLDSMLRKGEAGSEFIPMLCRLLSREDTIRTKALWCIGKLGQNKQGDSTSLRIICSFTKDSEAENRENTAWALGELAGAEVGDTDSLDSLIPLLEDEDVHVRGMAAWSVGRYADKLGIVNTDTVRHLENMTEEASPYLIKSAEFALERVKARLHPES